MLASGAAAGRALREGSPEGIPQAASGSLAAFLDAMGTQSVLDNLRRYWEEMPIKDAIVQALKDAPSSFSPQLLNQVRQYIDPVKRDVRVEQPGLEGALREAFITRPMAKLPGLAGKLPERPGTFGERIETPQPEHRNWWNTFFNPANVSTYQPRPVAQEMIRLNVAPGEMRAMGEKGEVREPLELLRARERRTGKLLGRAGDALVTDPDYKALSPEGRQHALELLRNAVVKEGKLREPDEDRLDSERFIKATEKWLEEGPEEREKREERESYVPPKKRGKAQQQRGYAP